MFARCPLHLPCCSDRAQQRRRLHTAAPVQMQQVRQHLTQLLRRQIRTASSVGGCSSSLAGVASSAFSKATADARFFRREASDGQCVRLLGGFQAGTYDRTSRSRRYVAARRGYSFSISSEVQDRWNEFFWECKEEGPDGTDIFISQRRRPVDKITPVEQPRSLLGKADLTGLRVWEASRVFGKYLRHRHEKHGESFAGLSACELGSGTGAGGLFAACMGVNVVMTDPAKPLNYAPGLAGNTMDVLQHNLHRNQNFVAGNVSIQKLLWGTTEDVEAVLSSAAAPFDVIIGTDLMYAADNEALLKTILALSHPNTKTLLSYSRRHDGEQRFIDLAAHTYHFDVEVLNLTAAGEVDPSATTYRLMTLSGRGWAGQGRS